MGNGRTPDKQAGKPTAPRPPLPIWAIPILLVILGIILLIGNLSSVMGLIVGAEVVGVCAYLLWRVRGEPDGARPISNVLSLFPGHMLLLLAVSLVESPDRLAALWAIVPIATIIYDQASLRMPVGPARTSILIGGYAILWAVLFALLERLIAFRRAATPRGEIIVATAIGVFGLLFISLGIYRHIRAGKE